MGSTATAETLEPSPLWAIRLAREEDHSFVFATWLRSYRHTSAFSRTIGNATYFRMHHQAIDRILRRGAEVRIACAASSPETILGYLVREEGIVHFAYVKKPFRRMGIAKALFAGFDPNGCVYTHETSCTEWLKKLWPNAEYNPYVL